MAVIGFTAPHTCSDDFPEHSYVELPVLSDMFLVLPRFSLPALPLVILAHRISRKREDKDFEFPPRLINDRGTNNVSVNDNMNNKTGFNKRSGFPLKKNQR
ncbi:MULTISPECIES: hypothetical protein [Klebsiella]|nr:MULTISPECIES: hypothetical protein [Klebsiella]MBE0132955.1 hypothetical protein [Klebsiella michiganensis]MBE0200962.1 hypothetical protein [Klebsiella michiganensis]MBX4642437.1 hypothetical protein [Klebsiella michiganensis]MBZ7436471.1 hypothetical protein [Klebsiella michiganensis]MBZ7491118.1 hypothetical protein [Klebsiella michiganensis]